MMHCKNGIVMLARLVQQLRIDEMSLLETTTIVLLIYWKSHVLVTADELFPSLLNEIVSVKITSQEK